jgi:hypothetical protein
MNTTNTPYMQAFNAHMEELKRQYKAGHSVQDIAEYIATVRRNEGRFHGDELRSEFGKWWKTQQKTKP